MKINKILAMTLLTTSLITSVAFAAIDFKSGGNIAAAQLIGDGRTSAKAQTRLHRAYENAPMTYIGYQRNGKQIDYGKGGGQATVSGVYADAFYGRHESWDITTDRIDTTLYTWVNA